MRWLLRPVRLLVFSIVRVTAAVLQHLAVHQHQPQHVMLLQLVSQLQQAVADRRSEKVFSLVFMLARALARQQPQLQLVHQHQLQLAIQLQLAAVVLRSE